MAYRDRLAGRISATRNGVSGDQGGKSSRHKQDTDMRQKHPYGRYSSYGIQMHGRIDTRAFRLASFSHGMILTCALVCI